MEGWYLLTWDALFGDPRVDAGVDLLEWLYGNDGNGIEEDEDGLGYWIDPGKFPDTNPADTIPDILQTGIGGGVTISQGQDWT